MTSPCRPLPVEILNLILLIILPGSPGLVGLSLWSVLLWYLLLSLLLSLLLLWLLDVVMVPVLNYLTAPALIQPVFCHLRNDLLESLLVLLRSCRGRPGLLDHWIEVLLSLVRSIQRVEFVVSFLVFLLFRLLKLLYLL